MNDLQVFFNGTDWVIASDEDEAMEVWEEECGESREDYDNMYFSPVEDQEKEFEIRFENPLHVEIPDTANVIFEDEWSIGYQAKLSEWAASWGRGFLASTEC